MGKEPECHSLEAPAKLAGASRPKASPRHQSQALLGLNELSRQVSVRSVTLTASLCLSRDGEGGLSPHGGCSQLALTGYSGRRVLITSDSSGTSAPCVLKGIREAGAVSCVCSW